MARHKSCLLGRGRGCAFTDCIVETTLVQTFAYSVTKAPYWQVRKCSICVLKGKVSFPVAADLRK